MILKIKIHFYLIIFLFLSFQSAVNAQNGKSTNYKAIYRLTYQPSKVDNSQKQEDMLLFIGSDYTVFLSLGKHKKDSLLRNRKNTNSGFSSILRNLPKTEFDYVIFNEISNSNIVYKQKVLKDNFSYKENPELKWEIHNEKKTIAGYLCKKARTKYAGREYSAWFTSEIPVSSGPYKFGGLPGLILEISDSEEEYHFKLSNLKKIENPISFYDSSNTIKTEKKVFLKVLKEYEENPFKKMEETGIKINFSDNSKKTEMLKEHKEKLKENNPIELKTI
ncbi:GLPGLI family protein [Salinimicrobium sp. CDJ15-81-2]|jgi:GLPGLI family protein|nr:GLPGLI family protein [Salinimicrobium nanhaiense]